MPRKNAPKEEEYVVLYLRVPRELKDRIQESANKRNRSVNQEALTLIQEALQMLERETDSKGQ